MNRLFISLLFFSLTLSGSLAQAVFRIDSLPAQGVLLDKGWKFQTGDNPGWAKPAFDDGRWAGINPTKDIFDLPQLDKATGQIGWFRLRLRLGSTVAQQLVLQIRQSGASEVHLNGQLIHRFGHIGKTPAETEAFTPNNSPVSFPALAGREQVLAVRYALQPGIRYGQHFGSNNPGLSIRLNRTETATSAYRQSMLSERGGTLYVGSFGVLALLFFTFFLFFPARREALYFALFCSALFFTWSTFYYAHLPIKVQDLFFWNNFVLVMQAIGYTCLLLSVYTVLAIKRGWVFWSIVALSAVAIYCGTYIYPWGWTVFGFGVTNLVNLDATRLAFLAVRRGQRGAWIIVIGGIFYMIAWFLFCFQFLNLYSIPSNLDLFSICILSIPAAYAIYFGYDFALTNRVLEQKLTEVETLSGEKQQILATQNQTLERQVTARTAELVGKNRELEIEAALEKIRSTSLAMRHSDEIAQVVVVLFEKLNELGLEFDGGAGIHVFTEGLKDAAIWVVSPQQFPTRVRLPYSEDDFVDNPIILDVWQAKESGQPIVNKTYSFEQKNRYFQYVFKHNDNTIIPEMVRNFVWSVPTYTATFIAEQNSLLGVNSWSGQLFSESDVEVLKKVARAFEQAYIRFLDLQKAEAQAREAQVELSLEKVRSRSMAMHQSHELSEAASVLFQQIKDLGFEMWSCGFCIYKQHDFSELWMSADSGGLLPPMMMPYKEEPTHRKIYEAFLRGDAVHEYVWEGEELKKHYEFLYTIPSVKDAIDILNEAGLALPAKQCYYVGFFKQGYLLIITKEPNAVMGDLSYRFARVFEQTYTRFLDLQKAEQLTEQTKLDLIQIQTEKKRAEDALTELRITQTQLIQKEKLASLGELTAGIAHEIQNPLNFVNNFSEVSAELVTELEEEQQKPNRDTNLEADLLGDLKQNLQKITHHGGRASAIVKGMLEHSRTSPGEREPTDFNALADEYLRLAYQGLRAKDKNFNADLKTDFAAEVGQVEVIPQEIGRVLLNLYNNAFYAVREKQQSAPATYQPTVWVSTKQTDKQVEIRVRDNGTGISDAVKAKIFQPFFTTKPTGEGTGLGLSLSYDIITKGHGGAISVDSHEGEGTEFVVSLPIS